MSPSGWNQRRQRNRGSRSHRRPCSLLPAMLLVLLVLLQCVELHMCRQLMRRSDPAAALEHVHSVPDKRSATESLVSQPKEIFSAPNDAADTSYDEYPVSDTWVTLWPTRGVKSQKQLSYRLTHDTFFFFW